MTAREWSLASLLERVTELESALKPFALVAPAFAGRAPGARIISTAIADVTIGDLQEAARCMHGSRRQ